MAEETNNQQVQNEPANQPEPKAEPAKAKTYSEAEYNALKSQLDEAMKTIQSYKDMDIDGIKKSVEDYKLKWEQSEADRKAFEYKTQIGAYVRNLNLIDDIYEEKLISLIAEKSLQFDGDKLIGGDDIVKGFKEKYPHAFRSEPDSNTPIAKFTAPMNTKNVNITAEDFRKMGIGERIKIKAANPELYKQFTSK